MQQKRAEFRDEIAELDVRDLVFVDESGWTSPREMDTGFKLPSG